MGEQQKISNKQIIETGIVFGLAFIVAGLYIDKNLYFSYAIGILLTTLVFPIVIKPIAFLWFGLSKILGKISTNIILTAVFYVIVMPVGLVRKAFGKDTLQLKGFKKVNKSVFVNRDHLFVADDLKYQF